MIAATAVAHVRRRRRASASRAAKAAAKPAVGGGEPPHAPSAARNRAIQAPIASGRVFSAVRLTIRRLVIVRDHLGLHQPVGLQRRAGLHQIDDQRATARGPAPVPSRRSGAPPRPARRARRSGGGRCSGISSPPAPATRCADRRCRRSPPARRPRRGRRRCPDRAGRRFPDSRTPSARRRRRMPSWAAPKATKVATSNGRTRTTSSPGSSVGKRRRRLSSSAIVGRRHDAGARQQRRRIPSRMRPFGSASTIGAASSGSSAALR